MPILSSSFLPFKPNGKDLSFGQRSRRRAGKKKEKKHKRKGLRSTLTTAAVSSLATTPQEQSLQFQSTHFIGPDEPLLNGFQTTYDTTDRLHPSGQFDPSFASCYEAAVFLIDKSKDTSLAQLCQEAKKRCGLLREDTEKTMALADLVLEQCPQKIEEKKKYPGELLLLCDEGIQKKRLFMCQQRALLFKVLCDEVNIPCALHTGFFRSEEGWIGHSWNEVHPKPGRQKFPENRWPIIVDLANYRARFIPRYYSITTSDPRELLAHLSIGDPRQVVCPTYNKPPMRRLRYNGTKWELQIYAKCYSG